MTDDRINSECKCGNGKVLDLLIEQNDKLREENLVLRDRCSMLQDQIDTLVDETFDLDEALR